MLRALIYAAVSVSGMMLVFVVRTKSYSFASRPAMELLLAFVVSQVIASAISALGFGGYTAPLPASESCYFCQYVETPFGYSGPGHIAGTEGVHEPSVIGCGWYVLVAWVWSAMWHLAMDPLKFAMACAMNGDGVGRGGLHWAVRADAAACPQCWPPRAPTLPGPSPTATAVAGRPAHLRAALAAGPASPGRARCSGAA